VTALDEVTAPRIEQDGPDTFAGDFTYVDISSVDNQAKRIVEPKTLATSEAPIRARQRLRAGDVLVSMTRPNLNAVAIVPPALDGAVGSTGFHVLRAKDGVLPEWLYFAVQTRRFVDEMSSLVQGALYPAVRPKDIRAFRLPISSLAEQRRIVAEIEKQFSRLDEAVANLRRVKENLRRYADAALTAATTDCSRTEAIKWVWASVGDLGAVRGGKRLPAGHQYAEGPTPYPYLRVTDFRGFSIDDSSLRYLNAETRSEIARYTISSDDVYISIAGTIGLVGQVPRHLDGASLTENAAKITGLVRVRPAFLVYWLASPKGRELVAGSTIATTQAKLALYRIERLPVPVPPLDEQERIVTELDRRLSIVRGVEAEVDANLKRAQALRQAVLARAFSGEPLCAETPLSSATAMANAA